MFGNKKM